MLARQCEEAGETELIVVHNAPNGSTGDGPDQHPAIRRLHRPQHEYTPELWAEGIRESSGSIVALTTDQFLPAHDWVGSILSAYEKADPSVGGLGGSIEQHPTGGIVDWAVYFVRYAAFMPPFEECTVREIAADNASYRKDVIDRYQTAWESGFWEPDVHREMHRDGATLRLTPLVRSYHVHSYGVRDFARNRFNHARQHGASRAAHFSKARRWAQIAAVPVVPLILTLRAMRHVVRRGGSIGRFVLALPLILLFYSSWAAGELTGTLREKSAE